MYKPGEEGRINLIFTTPNHPGPVTKHLYLVSNDPKNPRFELLIKADIELSIVNTPKSYEFSLCDGKLDISPIIIQSKDGKPFSIRSFSSIRNAITADFDRTEKATEFKIIPKVDIAKLKQARNGNITINISHPETSIIRIPYTAPKIVDINRPVVILQQAETGQSHHQRCSDDK